MEIRQAVMEELPEVLGIYEGARAFMRATGNPDQWGQQDPPASLIAEDIRSGRCYLCTEQQEILGVFSFFTEPDPTYARIYEGAWRDDSPYGTIHRVAVRTPGRGVAAFCFQWGYARAGHLRIDTHRDNLPMQRALEKSGFQYCGIIHLADGQERIAFEKVRV